MGVMRQLLTFLIFQLLSLCARCSLCLFRLVFVLEFVPLGAARE